MRGTRTGSTRSEIRDEHLQRAALAALPAVERECLGGQAVSDGNPEERLEEGREDRSQAGRMSWEPSRRDVLKSGVIAAIGAALGGCALSMSSESKNARIADLLVLNGKVTTLDAQRPLASAVAIKDGRILGVGSDDAMAVHRGAATAVIDVAGRAVIPGLNDSHTHLIRGGLNYAMELAGTACPRWPTPCACCESRRSARPRPTGSGSSAAGRSSSLRSAGCRRSMR